MQHEKKKHSPKCWRNYSRFSFVERHMKTFGF